MTRFLATEGGSAEREAKALSERLPPAWAPPPSCQHYIFGFDPLTLQRRPQVGVTQQAIDVKKISGSEKQHFCMLDNKME